MHNPCGLQVDGIPPESRIPAAAASMRGLM